jgi:hypothetical protein
MVKGGKGEGPTKKASPGGGKKVAPPDPPWDEGDTTSKGPPKTSGKGAVRNHRLSWALTRWGTIVKHDDGHPVLAKPEVLCERLEILAYNLIGQVEAFAEEGTLTPREAVGALKISTELSGFLRKALGRKRSGAGQWSVEEPSSWSDAQLEAFEQRGELPEGPPPDRMLGLG